MKSIIRAVSSPISRGFLILFFSLFVFSLAAPASADIIILGKTIRCDPAFPPNAGGCGLINLVEVIKAATDFLLKLALPLAGVFIVWGGIVIMSAGGSEARFSKGKSILTWAIVGLAIVLGAWLIVFTIFLILPTDTAPGQNIGNILFPGKSINP